MKQKKKDFAASQCFAGHSFSKAQTASELAIFGAILIFVLGLIIRYATNFNFMQSQTLKAMRMAMRESFMSAEAGRTSRNYASILFIEDRKEAQNTKYGSLSRTPYVVGGAGMFSKNLYMGTDFWSDRDVWNPHMAMLPVMDVFVNGKHFVFRTAGLRESEIARKDSDGTVYPFSSNPDLFRMYTTVNGGERRFVRAPPNTVRWEPTCIPGIPGGCVSFLRKVVNENYEFCAGPDCVSTNLDADDRFDLDRNGAIVPPALRPHFSWQWYKVRAIIPGQVVIPGAEGISLPKGINVSVDVDGDLKEEQILEMTDQYDNIYTPHMTEEEIGFIESAAASGGFGVAGFGYTWFENRHKEKQGNTITKVRVIDRQEGDIDFTYDSNDEAAGIPPPGLKVESSIMSFTKSPGGPGTKLTLREGPFSGDGQFAWQIQKQDRIDIVERQIQLSNDTGFLCGNTQGGEWTRRRPWDSYGNHVPNPNNPDVEACNDCFSQENVYKTCFDEDSLILYVRSRIEDLRGHKWITDVEQTQTYGLGDVVPDN